MSRSHGVTSTTTNNLIIDSGAVYLDYGESGEVLLGATRGGNTFSITTEYREMEFDGSRGPVVGGRRITRVDTKLTANIVEFSPELIQYALPGSTETDNTTYMTIARALQLATTDHHTNVAIVGESSGAPSVPVVCRVLNPIVDGGFEMAFADKDETVLTLEFSGHFTVAAFDTEPWSIDYPVIA